MGDIVINKQGLIFLTLTSLILVLSVYYVTMPTELLLTTNSLYNKEEIDSSNSNEEIVINNIDTISAMKSLHEDERIDKVKELNNKLINKELSVTEKNNIYEEIKVINKLEAIEDDIESIIKKEYDKKSFVKVDNDVVEITINSKIHDKTLVAKIMSSVEKKYPNMYISVNFKE